MDARSGNENFNIVVNGVLRDFGGKDQSKSQNADA